MSYQCLLCFVKLRKVSPYFINNDTTYASGMVFQTANQFKLKLTFLPINALDLLMVNSKSDLKCVKLDLARISKRRVI